MTEEQYKYLDKRVTSLMELSKKKNLSIPKLLDLMSEKEIKKLRNAKVVVKEQPRHIRLNNKFCYVSEMTDEEYDKEVELGFELNLLHND